MSDYNNYYWEKESYFWNPYAWFIEFFAWNKLWTSVLDLWCGQGRDTLALWRLWYEVTGVDNSSVWIKQMLKVAQEENLKVTGEVWDIYTYKDISKYDIILLDSMLHFYKNDKEKEIDFLTRILQDMKQSAIICVMVLKSPASEKIISSLLSVNNFLKVEDSYIDYPEANVLYRMFIYRR